MATRLVSFSVFLLGCSMFLPHASATVGATSQQATVAAEPSGPKPSAAVQGIIDEAGRLAEAKQPLDSLRAADQALEAARQTNDTAGGALAQEARAKALQDLQRTDDAVTAWQEGARMRAGLGDTPGQIRALVQAGLLCVSNKKSEAEKFFAQGLSMGMSETQHGEVVAQALHDSGVALNARRQTQPAWETQTAWDYLRAALAIWEKQVPDSLKMVETLNALTQVAIERGDDNDDTAYYTMGRDYSARAAGIGQRLAPESSLVVESLYLLGHTEWGLASYGAAQEHELAALRIQRKLAPGGSMEEVKILTRLGKLEDEQTNFATAHQYLQEAVAIGDRLAPASMQCEQSLEGLGIEEISEGDLPGAREHLQRALAIKEKLHGGLASTLINLGVVASDQYDFASARDYFEQALNGYASTNPNAYGVVVALSNLRDTFLRQGDLATALEYGQRVLAIEKDKLVDIYTAEDLSVMGDILRDQGEFGAAADYYHKALDIREKLAPGSFHVSESLVALAKLARAQQDISLAMEYDRRALMLAEKSCPNSWCVAAIVNDLGELAYAQGDLASSESYLRRAVDVRERSLGPGHPDLARSLNRLALTVATQGRTPEALETALWAERMGAEHLRISVRTLSERQALAYEGIRASGLDLALTLAGEREAAASTRSEVFDSVIRSRALVFDELAARHRSAYGSRDDPQVTQLADQLSSARARLATLVFRGAGDTKPEVYRKLLDEVRERKEKAEQMLAERSIAFRQEQARTQLGLQEISAALPQGTAIVAFVRYARYDLQKPEVAKVAPEPVPSYAAFVLRAGKHEPEFVPLEAAREIESLLAAWRRDIARQAEIIDVSSKTGEDTYRRSGAALRQRIWDPLVPGLGNAREVFVVPDAALHLVSLASLPVGGSRYLVETGPLIHYLSTERDLVPSESRHGVGILVVGNPAFDHVGKLVVAANTPSGPTSMTAGAAGTLLRGTRSACGTFQTLRFPSLPGSQLEAENIAALWKQSNAREGTRIMRGFAVQPGSGELLQMTGAGASSEAFEQYAPGKRVLHVATHGFFLEGSCESAVQRRSDATKREESFLPAATENPLLLSGLAFVGANLRGSAKPDETDGILTSEEIAGINLEGVDWAVLSACDTGVGKIRVGEGVFGLRRAFQVAGAKTVIMSLWPVEDETTRQWMGTLYREHFLNGKDTAESVRAASLQILKQRRTKHQSTHPFYWGAFIAAGDWH
jgi:CHAT domain-containing protein/tetratricopeptide (TPR) repeat protein